MEEISRLLTAMEILRNSVHRGMPSQHISLLLAVAEKPGITMPELCRKLSMPQGTVSRNVKILSTYMEREDGVLKTRGHGLLQSRPDSANRHCFAVYLTGEGEEMVSSLMHVLYDEPSTIPSSGLSQASRF